MDIHRNVSGLAWKKFLWLVQAYLKFQFKAYTPFNHITVLFKCTLYIILPFKRVTISNGTIKLRICYRL